MQSVNYQISLYSPHENRKIEKKNARKRCQDISEEVENLERTKDGTNRMRDMSKKAN